MLPAAAWLAPVFLLRYLRGGRAAPRLTASALVFYLTQLVAWRGLVPVPGAAYFVIVLAIALAAFAPYFVDRLVAPRIQGFASTLVFPCAWAAAEYLTSIGSPYGSWGNAAYSQVDALPLIQLVAVTGLWGVGFLIAWFAAVVNWAWERRFEWTAIRTGALAYAGVLAAVLLWGGARVAPPPSAPSVRIASVTVTPRRDAGDLLFHRREGAALRQVRADLAALHDSLFEAARREARAGAKLVFWSETNFQVTDDDVEAQLARGAALARQEGICLGMAIAQFVPGAGYYENQLVVFNPTGAVVARYHKARPVPGDPERGADREIPVFDTPLGRVAGAICFDMDFPGLIRKAGRERSALILAPSSDWRAIDPIHTRMALVRGIENGCPVVRQTNQGLSAAGDDRGRILAAVDYFHTRPHVMVAQVPVGAHATIYSKLGDWFAYLCGVVVAGFVVSAVPKRKSGAGV